jgi:hypothetical protein
MDIFNLPNNDINNAIFYTAGSGDTWQTWVKPRNTKFIYITTIGGGGGGGSSPNTGAGTNRYGGGGGGCSSMANGYFPAVSLPDILYIQVGTGGAGGVLGTTGSAGAISYVSTQPNNLRTNVVLANGNSGGGGGGAGTAAAVGAGGTAGLVLTQVNCGLSYLGSINFNVGQVGIAGGTTNGGGSSYINNILPVSPGVGGAGVTSGNVAGAGGGIAGGSVWPAINGGLQSTSTPAGDGNSGYSFLPSPNTNRNLPLFSTGGAGGGSSTLSSGGNGGNGGFGSGGGGGAGGVNAPGRGGNGGDGLVIITCF